MRIEPLGDSAFIMRDLAGPAHQVALSVRNLGVPGVTDVVPSYDTIGVYVDPGLFSVQSLDDLDRLTPPPPTRPRNHLIPVDYSQGEDMAEVCDRLGLTPREVVESHIAATLTCHAVGFCPGFPYLGYLTGKLATLPRKDQPVARIQPGTVAVAADQTGIYPIVRPGGWWRVGLTPLCIVDVDDGYFPISAGDTVRFESVSSQVFDGMRGDRL